MNSKDIVSKVLENCVSCELLEAGNCKYVQEGVIDDCIPAITPTNEEVVLLAGVTEKIMQRIRDQIKVSAMSNGVTLDAVGRQ